MSTLIQSIVSPVLRTRIPLVCNHGFHYSATLGIQPTDLYSMRVTSSLFKVDRQLDSAKIEKMKVKINRELRRLSKKGIRVLKPVDEKMIWPKFKREIKMGIRERHNKGVFNSEELETGILLGKEWSRVKKHQTDHEQRVIDRVTKCQERTLRKLKEESEELYLKAIELDDSLLQYKSKGPVETPPKENYYAQDGQYADRTEYFTKEKFYNVDPRVKEQFRQDQRKKAL